MFDHRLVYNGMSIELLKVCVFFVVVYSQSAINRLVKVAKSKEAGLEIRLVGVENTRVELVTSCMPCKRSSQLS